MIRHKPGELLGAKFTDQGELFISLGRGPGNTTIAIRANQVGRRQIFIMDLPKPAAISKDTPVDASELEVRP